MTPSPTSARSVVAAFEGCEASSALLSSLVAEGWTVEALCVDAGQDLPPDLSERATALGASRVRVLERRQQTFERRLRWLIAANALHGGADPLWWLAERYAWPEAMAEAARSSEATAIAWTCPDPEESALWRRLLQRGGGERELLSPEASPAEGHTRLTCWGSVSAGPELDELGTTPDEEAFPLGPPAWEADALPETFELGFTQGIPTHAGGALDPLNLIAKLTQIGARHALGCSLHVGSGLLPAKRRRAHQAPAAELIRVAHTALERALLDEGRLALKDTISQQYVESFRLGRADDPLADDLEAYLASTQAELTGRVRLRVYRGRAKVVALSALGVRQG